MAAADLAVQLRMQSRGFRGALPKVDAVLAKRGLAEFHGPAD